MRIIILPLFLLTFLISGPVFAESLTQTQAAQAIVVDFQTGAILFEKDADQRMPTSSMSKVMTMYLVFDALKNGAYKLDDTFKVSEKAWQKGGSKMFVEVGKEVKIEDLIRGVLVQSGNDATIVLAEGLAGSESTFAGKLTAKAHELGMNNSHFMNASGWPDPDHYSTARDLAILATATIKDFPNYYPYYAEQEFTFNNITQRNRNPLLYRDMGADGVKTGHTEAGGYGLIGSGVRDGRRVVMVVNGLADEKERAQESAKLLEWGLSRFVNKALFSADEVVGEAVVTMGKRDTVPLVVKDDVLVTIPKIALKEFTVALQYTGPVKAPVEAGQQIGNMVVSIPHLEDVVVPVYAAEPVDELGIFSKTLTKAKMLILHQGQE